MDGSMQLDPMLGKRILGGMMRCNSTLPTGRSLLRRESFRTEGDRVVFDAIVGLHQSGKPVDLVEVARHLGGEKIMYQVGGYLKLAEIWDLACLESDFEELVRLLNDV